MQAFNNAHERYFGMSLAEILGEDSNNFALPHVLVSSVKVKRKFSAGDDDGPGEPYLEMEWESASGKYKFRVEMDEGQARHILEQFYGGRIRR
jgi:hypothetical protein